MDKASKALTAIYAVGLEKFDNLMLAAANNALYGFGKIDKKNLSYQSFLEHDYIKENGLPYDNDMLLSALAIVIKERMELGKWV